MKWRHGKVFVPIIMSKDYCMSKENSHLNTMCLTSAEGGGKWEIWPVHSEAFDTISPPKYRNMEGRWEIIVIKYILWLVASKKKAVHIYI